MKYLLVTLSAMLMLTYLLLSPADLKESSACRVKMEDGVCVYLQVHEGPEVRSYILIQRADLQALIKSVIHEASAFVLVTHTHARIHMHTHSYKLFLSQLK